MSRIYTPRVSINMLLGDPTQKNKSTCTKIPYRGLEISIAMDSSHGDGDLRRSDILVDDTDGKDITFELLPQYDGVIPATAEALKEAFEAIDWLVAEREKTKAATTPAVASA